MARDSGIKKILKYRMKTVDNVKQMCYYIINKKKERWENENGKVAKKQILQCFGAYRSCKVANIPPAGSGNPGAKK